MYFPSALKSVKPKPLKEKYNFTNYYHLIHLNPISSCQQDIMQDQIVASNVIVGADVDVNC